MEYNIIAIGGTGMRCAESLVHLCAMGMFDNTEVNILALDTDYKNGNFKRLKELVDNYHRITADRDGAAADTLFSAKINYFSFSPDYQQGANFEKESHYSDAQTAKHGEDGVEWRESDLTDLFLTEEVRSMDLQHGYRAQTQMGSMLMYHAIVAEAYKYRMGSSNNTGLDKFIENLMNPPGSKVFLFGSVFGGTGASSIPILPRALQKAAQIISQNGEGDVLSNNLFGTVMLTNYFRFDSPVNQGEVVATSDKFALNSQAALFFYHNDQTVRSTYKRFYLIGRDEMRYVTRDGVQSLTGGEGQCNPEDFIELMAASAAYDFFKKAQQHETEAVSGAEGDIQRRTISSDEQGRLTFETFFGEDKELFAEKCGIMMASAFLFGPQNWGEFCRTHQSSKLNFGNIKEADVQDLRLFFRRFYDLEGLGPDKKSKGWIKQIQESAAEVGYQGFLFHPNVYTVTPDKAHVFKYDLNLYPERSQYSDNFGNKTKLMIGRKSAFDVFKDEFNNRPDLQGLQETVSNLLRRTFLTFRDLYGFPHSSNH